MNEKSNKPQYKLTILGKAMIIFSVLFILTATLSVGIGYNYSFTAGVKTRNVFKDPLMLAETTWSADTAIEYVQIAIDGIETLGLEPTDYHTYFPWGKTFANSIENTYAEMYSSIEVLEDIVKWKEKQYGTTQMTGEIIADLYHEKMDNYHDHVNTVTYWTSDIEGAYALKNGYIAYYFNGYIALANLFLLVGVITCFMIHNIGYDEPFRERVRQLN